MYVRGILGRISEPLNFPKFYLLCVHTFYGCVLSRIFLAGTGVTYTICCYLMQKNYHYNKTTFFLFFIFYFFFFI